MVSIKHFDAPARLPVPMRTAAGVLLTATLLASAFVGGRAGAAEAVSSADPPSIQVHYADLDPKTDQGARILLRRITAAALRVCPRADGRDLENFAVSRACRQQAIARAVRDVGSSRLTALTGKRPRHEEMRHG